MTDHDFRLFAQMMEPRGGLRAPPDLASFECSPPCSCGDDEPGFRIRVVRMDGLEGIFRVTDPAHLELMWLWLEPATEADVAEFTRRRARVLAH